MIGIPLVVLCLGITFGGDMSTINPCIAGSSRYIYKMAKENVIPVALSKIHPRFHTPYISVIIVGVAVILLVMTDSILYIASVGLFSMLGTYIIAFIAYIGLKKRFPEIERPFKAPAGIIGAIISIALYLVLMSQIGREAMITGIIYTAAVMIFYFVRTKVFKAEAYEAETETFVLSEIEVPSTEEKRRMDRSFRWWLSWSIIAAAGAITLYIIAFLH
jgi:APA family basic amino acid/polyamine antiporter